MKATELSPQIWNSIADELDRVQAPREIVFGKVVRRDATKKVIYLEQFGNLAIPLVTFGFRFEYYDTDATGAVQKRADPTGTNEALQTKLIMPRVGQTAVILDPGGQHRFPVCIGVIQSSEFWLGEE